MNALKRITSKLKNINKEKEWPLSEDSAIEAIVEFCNYYDIDTGRLETTESTEVMGENIFQSLITYYRSGKLKNQKDENGFFVIQTLGSKKELKYKEPTAAEKMTMDKCTDKEHRTKLYTFMGALCNIGLDGVLKLKPQDLAVLEVLGNVFLLV